MQFTPEHEELRRSLQTFIDARDQSARRRVGGGRRSSPRTRCSRSWATLGLLGINKPDEYGGMGLDYSYADGDGRRRSATSTAAACRWRSACRPTWRRRRSPASAATSCASEFLAPSIAGDYVACLGVSEVGAGSDVASIKTTARKDGGDYVINGGKMWTTNGTQADWMCLLANTGEGPVHKNKSLICVPMKTKGVQVAKKLDKLGMRSSDTAQIFFDDVRVPQRYRIGEEGMGFIYQMQQFQEERLWARRRRP